MVSPGLRPWPSLSVLTIARHGNCSASVSPGFPRATHLVILVDEHRRQDWLLAAAEKRLREELELLQVEVNEDKSRTVDLAKGEASDSWGSSFGACAVGGECGDPTTPRRPRSGPR